MTIFNPKLLIVEGKNEELLIPELIEKAGVYWGTKDESAKWPAKIVQTGGIDTILEPGFIEAQLNTPGLKTLGILVDANSDPKKRWKIISQNASKSFSQLPPELPATGLVMQNEEGLRFGVWLMPNNVLPGMSETFLTGIAQESNAGLWKLTQTYCADAKSLHQAPYHDAHLDKALIHAWLSVQDPPGDQMHRAVRSKILNAKSSYAAPFIVWFRNLFQV